MPYIVVSPLSRLAETARLHRAADMVTLITTGTAVERPAEIAAERHLFLGFNDINAPQAGMTAPGTEHIEQFLAFARGWDRTTPLLVHCYAGISRSTAAAFIAAIALDPGHDERVLARLLRQRAPSATPNPRLIALADDLLGRKGRMVDAIAAIGRGADAFEGTPFMLPVRA